MFRQHRAGHAYHDPRGSAYTKTTVAVKTVKGNVSNQGDLSFKLCNVYHGAMMDGTCRGKVEGRKEFGLYSETSIKRTPSGASQGVLLIEVSL